MKTKLMILAGITIALILFFLFIDIGGYWGYVLQSRGKKLFAMVLTGSAIGVSTLIFQTITNNKILTPSIIGLDSLYMLIQTFVVFVFGANTLTMMNSNLHFLISVGLMIVFAGLLYKFLFKREGQNIYFLLLVGIILGTLFQSVSSFMEMLIDPNEFLVVQDSMFASFNNVNTNLLLISCIAIVGVGLYALRFIKYLDVLSLGKDQAINLGVPYNAVVKRLLIIVAILISVSTALVGPITFLGLLVVNITYQFLGTYQHKPLILGSMLISVIALVGGQLIVEHVLSFSTTVSVIINLLGGIYFIYLLLKENKSW
ncbi:iron complex transport system permease protein [Pullulanibacillus pueri]|uniref:Putative ABC transporter permease protein YclO n=1 Tax=Pullulanibacillus pueri TaxID=1437324 RepID=A0A8J2ZTV5_9BACL|nr:iron chelate uptake ABC transporter family permease subunit [Pullulanibacillus pueri]MBM7680294.1 iron complex transport system permease protein [Pullulanibacillus pueri]GGH75794.1 putative ABC transporter permease protein YclO [Pullulanibacillus pueri]